MTVPPSAPFLDEAARLGRALAGGALRSGRRATWLADEMALTGGRWRPVLATLGPDLGTGTAGVGWALARVAAVTADAAVAEVAAEALRHALDRCDAMVRAGRLDWYEGASGVAWAAVDAGRALGRADLVAAGTAAAGDVTEAARGVPADSDGTALRGGGAGVLAGLLALTLALPSQDALAAARAAAPPLAAAVPAFPPDAAAPALGAGLARGLSGVGLALAAAAAAGGEPAWRAAARRAFALERLRYEPGAGWAAGAAHEWRAAPSTADASWCAGAAGIGIARLAAHSLEPEPLLLAEAGAAVEIVRAALAAPPDRDTCLCHGATGGIALLAAAGALLAEPAHIDAARRAGAGLVARARARGWYGTGADGLARNPSLLLGLAGTVALLLQLHEPGALPSPALPAYQPQTIGGT